MTNKPKTIADALAEVQLKVNEDKRMRAAQMAETYLDEAGKADALKALELQFNVKPDYDFDEDTGRLISYELTPKSTQPGFRPGVNLGKVDLMKMIREELKEITGAYGGDAMDAEDGSSYLENK